MAEEKKEKAKTVGAAPSPRPDRDETSADGGGENAAPTGDGRGENAAPTGDGRGENAAPTGDGGGENAAPTGDGRGENAAPAEPDWKDHYARLLADFDNYKKRAQRDREDTYRYAESDILKDVLPTVDNLALALQHAKNPDDEFVKGVQLVYDNLIKALKEHGAEPFDCVGKDLDTERMEAIATLPSPDVPEGKVSIESKRGWMLRDKVLRAAQVVVSSGAPQ